MILAVLITPPQYDVLLCCRSLSGKLRIGLAEQSVLMALSHAVVYTPPGQGTYVCSSS